MRIALLGMTLCLLAGCDRDPPAPPPAPKKLAQAVEVTSLTPLPPDRRTHIAPVGDGQTFWVQESEAGRETVFAISDGGLPSATRFTNASVLEALGETAVGATGSIQALTAGSDGKLYFYFAGGKGRRTLAAFGCFAPSSGRTQILADGATLARELGMGDSLALARGSIVRVGAQAWLWLRHDDGYALLVTDTTLSAPAPRRPFERIRGDGPAPNLNAATEDLSPGPGGDLAYLDRRDGRIWRIDPQGVAAVLRDVRDLPIGVTAPVLDERGRLVLFAPDDRAFNEPVDDLDAPPRNRPVEYPALILIDGDHRTTLAREAFVVPAKSNVRSMVVPQLVRDRSGWVAYRPQTGELLRFRLVDR